MPQTRGEPHSGPEPLDGRGRTGPKFDGSPDDRRTRIDRIARHNTLTSRNTLDNTPTHGGDDEGLQRGAQGRRARTAVPGGDLWSEPRPHGSPRRISNDPGT